MDFEKYEKPLLELDPILEKFASEQGLIVFKNQKDWPERSIVWGNDVRCLIQIYLASEKNATFNLWLCASKDTNNERFWKHDTPIKSQPINHFKDELYEMLNDSFVKLNNWASNEHSLEFATRISAV